MPLIWLLAEEKYWEPLLIAKMWRYNNVEGSEKFAPILAVFTFVKNLLQKWQKTLMCNNNTFIFTIQTLLTIHKYDKRLTKETTFLGFRAVNKWDLKKATYLILSFTTSSKNCSRFIFLFIIAPKIKITINKSN